MKLTIEFSNGKVQNYLVKKFDINELFTKFVIIDGKTIETKDPVKTKQYWFYDRQERKLHKHYESEIKNIFINEE